ncbi:unnamed protein product [Mytilus coruscus]|uniref:Reverse transcriptase domain-containing protein n=1 Tax=Mytilus coruscus TaxID=42192 RepID=A0A6J8DBL9_MYTCO|nr:unnamed protein product [Mytilus coruscus]
METSTQLPDDITAVISLVESQPADWILTKRNDKYSIKMKWRQIERQKTVTKKRSSKARQDRKNRRRQAFLSRKKQQQSGDPTLNTEELETTAPPQMTRSWKYLRSPLIWKQELKINKSPGVDGIGKSFYTKFWNIIGEDLIEILNNVYLNGELTESMKTGLILLVYKNKGNRKDLKQWRPISVLCVDYKILTKFLSKNLSKVINKLLDKNQTGAGQEKLISGNHFGVYGLK